MRQGTLIYTYSQFSTILFTVVTRCDGLDASMATNIIRLLWEQGAGDIVATTFSLDTPVNHLTQNAIVSPTIVVGSEKEEEVE